jgi:hypothetical protein
LVPTSYAAYFAAVAAIVLLGSVVAKFVTKQRSDDKEWFDGRAVAESLKSLTWRYMMRLEPFEDDATSNQKFIEELDATREARSGIKYNVGAQDGTAEQISAKMREVRQLTVEERRDLYVKERLEDQAKWYAGTSEDNRRLANRLFTKDMADKSPASTTLVVTMSRVSRKRPDSAGEGSRAAKSLRVSGIPASPSQGRAIMITAQISACPYAISQYSSGTLVGQRNRAIFLEPPLSEVPRTPLLRTRVNRGAVNLSDRWFAPPCSLARRGRASSRVHL